jgi:hypothetical protein
MKLFRVERTTMPNQRTGRVYVDVFAVVARTAAEAKEKARQHCPPDELDGRVVLWSVEEDGDGIMRAAGCCIRSATVTERTSLVATGDK